MATPLTLRNVEETLTIVLRDDTDLENPTIHTVASTFCLEESEINSLIEAALDQFSIEQGGVEHVTVEWATEAADGEITGSGEQGWTAQDT